ncbi:MAG: ATP-binding protein [Clostridia bacterium]|nr:ATP-binding protein [Clostridia bacterium]
MIIIAIFVVAACILFTHTFDEQLYMQRAYSLAQTMEKVVEVVNRTVDSEWDRLKYVSYELFNSDYLNVDAVIEHISDVYADMSTPSYVWRVGFIDGNGAFYRWDKRVVRWSRPELLLDDRPAQQLVITESSESDAEQMILIYRLPHSIILADEDITITHTLITLDMSSFGESLDVSAFEDRSLSYITDQNGMRLYHQENQDQFMSAYNMLAGLRNVTFLYDSSYERLYSAIENAVAYTFEIEHAGEKFFVSYAPLSFNNWNLFWVIPEDGVSGNTTQMLQTMVMQLSIIAVMVIVLIALFVWNNSRQTIAKQQLAVEEAVSASRAKSDFLSHMSHDIRTPLNSIIGMCHIARRQVTDPKTITDCLEKIDISSHQLMSLVNDVLDMTRIEHGKIEINYQPMDIYELLKECSVHIEAQTRENNIRFEKDISSLKHPYVLGDAVLLNQILTNLLGNAVKFTPEGGSIWLRASDDGGGYHFEVEDTGIGMTREFMMRLFEPFTQEHGQARTKYNGSGLGLSIVKSLIDKMGGEISVQSTLSKGSCFSIFLPLERCDEADVPRERKRPASPVDISGMRVLLVEDNDINRMIAETILKEFRITVDTAVDGQDAVDRFRASPVRFYDLVLMDLRMPVMDGLEACRCIRALAREDSDVPIVALTADAFDTDMKNSTDAGMNDHLGKPIDIAKLNEILKKYKPA